MPSTSTKQARFMAACAHGAGYASCPPSKVSTEFNQADKGSPMLSKAMRERSAERRVRKQFGGAMSMGPAAGAMGTALQRPQTGVMPGAYANLPWNQPGYKPPAPGGGNSGIMQALQALQGRGGTAGAGNMAGWLGGGGFQGAGGMGRAIPQGGIPWGGGGGFGPGMMKGAGDMMARPGQGAFRGPIGPPGGNRLGGVMGGAGFGGGMMGGAPTGPPNPVARPGGPGGPPMGQPGGGGSMPGGGGGMSPQFLQGLMSRMGAGGGGAPPAFQAPPGAGQPMMNACSVPAMMKGQGPGPGGGTPGSGLGGASAQNPGLWGSGPGSFGYMGGTLAPGSTMGASPPTARSGLSQLAGSPVQGGTPMNFANMGAIPQGMGMMGFQRGGMIRPPGLAPGSPTGAPMGSPLPMARPAVSGLSSLLGGAMAGRHAGFPGPRKPRIPMPGSLRNINQPINRTRGLGPV